MAWGYSISTGVLTHGGGVIGKCYSGHGEGLNNPTMCGVKNIGPLPSGWYTFGPPIDPPDHLGPLAMPMIPDADTDMQGRSDIFCHGDNAEMNHTASCGCLIAWHYGRTLINLCVGDDRRILVEV